MFRTFNPIPYMPPVLVGDLRDNELIIDLTGNLDSCA